MKPVPNTNHKFRNLLLFLLLYIFVSPFLEHYPSLGLVAHASLTMTLFTSVYTVQKKAKYRSYTMVLLVPVVILYWVGLYEIAPLSREASYLLLALFYGLLTVTFASQLAQFDKITPGVVYGALCVYLMVGLLWGSLYALLASLSPGSFSGVLLEGDHVVYLHVYNYFSMVTLTTLGYGDITPQTPGAAALCQLEAITGQLFIAVVVGWIVGNFVSEKNRHSENKQ